MKIKDIFEKSIDRRIEEVIKVTQIEESVVYDEISEYVVTDAIKDYFIDILKAYSEAPSDPHEGIGIWVSGFFGSGKSSFAKILGYILEGRNILGEDEPTVSIKSARIDSKIAGSKLGSISPNRTTFGLNTPPHLRSTFFKKGKYSVSR